MQTLTSTKLSESVPGPHEDFLLGSMRAIRRDRLKFVLDMALQYRDVVKFHIAYIPIVQINHPEGIQRVLQDNNRNYHKGFDMVPTLEMTLGHGLLTNEGESWLHQRRLMSPVFHHHNVESFGELMTRMASAHIAQWETRAQARQPLNLAPDMMQLTLDIVTHALFGADVTNQFPRIGEAINVMLRDAILRFDLPFYPPPAVPTPHNRRFRRAMATLNQVIYGIINERRLHPTGTNDLLNLLLNARDEETGAQMDDKQLRDEVITLFLAGHETTANWLAWAFYLLAQHPDVEARVRQELVQTLDARVPTVADLPSLAYTRRMLDETLRLYPSAWILNRVALESDEICGYPIPARSFVAISPYVMHHHPKYWDNPERFDPDRFAPEREAHRPRFVYFPFGSGPRLCIGRGFAQVEAQLVLATILQKCRLTLAPGADVGMEPLVTLRPRGGLPMMVDWNG
jgi:cytochrome P450